MSSTTSTSTSTSSTTSTVETITFQTGVQYGFFFDQSRCNGCSACAVACKDWNNIPPGPVKLIRTYEWEEGAFPSVRVNYLHIMCFHCANPVCIPAANGAIYKEPNYGAVLLDPAQASSSNLKAAWNACPYGAIVFDSDGANSNAFKCNMCIDKLMIGQNPVCVMACPVRALDFGPISQLKQTYGTNQQLSQMPDPTTVQPSIVFKPKSAKPQIVPYDTTRALTLNGQRGSTLPPLYTDPSVVTSIPPGVVGRSSLVLKHATVEDLMRATQNDD